MINKKFLVSQLKNLMFVILIIGILMGLVSLLGLSSLSFSGYNRIEKSGSTVSTHLVPGGADLLKYGFFYTSAPILIVVYSLVSVINLFLKENSKGYLESWLTTTMSRATIYWTKFLAYVLGYLIIMFFTFIIQMIFYGALLTDFKLGIGRLLLTELALFLFLFMIIILIWFGATAFNRTSTTVIVVLTLFFFFIVMWVISEIGSLTNNQIMINFKYATIFSLFNDCLIFQEGGEIVNKNPGLIYEYGKLLPIQKMAFVWQLPTMLVIAITFTIPGLYIYKNRSFYI
ncbi:ABC-2 family transporter [Entomoplasma freundtii]|uniref:Uncharacterized protein n=1 Tax=Entomoplasma freundtii TaxID=74700 RepID=A0A2K8NSB0_9MOLU|nr:ABC transporter permease subunit [Entomoplasma freundtii]ATZ16038.1 hypothetical protein EFREU_v1c00110 [Entomoplasma freundtii]TDY58093.1 ABC-2 family transporter [Entomoplasma freundtii]